MSEALKEARKAFEAGEVPVGAIIVNEEKRIIGRGYNLKETKKIPLFHAEIVAILDAHKNENRMYLLGCSLYTTLEPCPMCAGALINERISEIIFATEDKRFGACGSVYNLTSDNHLNHKIKVRCGILKDEASFLIKDFFERLRKIDV